MSSPNVQTEQKLMRRRTYFVALSLVVLAAIPIDYLFRFPRPTWEGLIEYAMLFPITFLLLMISPVAWVIFLWLPLATFVAGWSGFRRKSNLLLILSLGLAFASAIANGVWMEALMGV